MGVQATSHYEVLGVADGAEPDAVRKAYLDQARRLHPDRWIDASAEERAAVERQMQAVNEAWRVLGNAGRRLAYDVERREVDRRPRVAPPSAVGERFAFSSGDLFTEDVADIDLKSRLLRALPWILLLAGLGAIFIFTAYATSTSGRRPGGELARCVHTSGGEAIEVACTSDGAQRVVIEVPQIGLCPSGTEPFQPAARDQALCLEPAG